MIFYFVGSIGNELNYLTGKNVLLSYYYICKLPVKLTYLDFKKKFGFNKVFLDSGAFSAFTLGGFIHPDNYSWYLEHTEGIEVYANLDSIGKVEGTFKNQKQIEDRGLNPLPVFHYGEPFHILDYYCENYDYVCLGGLVPLAMKPKVLIEFLDKVFTKYPNKKFHGFGVSNPKIIKRYKWYSCDSSSYIQTRAIGGIMTMKYGVVTAGRKIDKSHITNQSEEVKNFLKEKCKEFNINYERMIDHKLNDYPVRTKFNVEIFQEFINEISRERGEYEDIIEGHPPVGTVDLREFVLDDEELKKDEKQPSILYTHWDKDQKIHKVERIKETGQTALF